MKKGNTQSMDSLNRLEIFIPDEADATTIHLCSLPAVLLKRMGLPLHDSKDSKKLAIWISPAVLRRKGQKPLSNTGKDALESASSLLGRRFRPLTGPFKMPIYSSNRAISNMLKDMNQGKMLSTCKSPTSLCPRGSPPQSGFSAIVIYHGCIYLCISKNNPSKCQKDTPSTHSVSPESQKKELHNYKRPRKICTTNNDSSSKAAAAAPEPSWFHPGGGQDVGANEDSGDSETKDLASDEAEHTSHKDEGGGDVHMERGAVTLKGNQSCTGRESLGATPLGRECDFDELVQEEKIAQMKARLRLLSHTQ
ncbi:uncharacterized protein LOC133956711 isoform X2 [Platichthys flesus]|uniref:uncharacterized protein LOC133956711 isoform X2 n=1 Tax=Platichthys flesus TaxID=8260 RepID=UPI001A836BCF|nr:uncharacterized protein LOC133956711 isoform X2 [Platichthys flesus]